ncbi:DUF4179 domain-containing protein [Evansella sp. AB-rgal1]|uniref:DUF4179 domain-containing protein n=1 Tax=Evansella sp. AB-rgal1 TaxID=3242696 RepID=UPI00359DA6F7
MDCQTCRDLLVNYVDGDLIEKDKNELVEHIENCSFCANEYQELKKSVAFIKKEASQIYVPPKFFQNVEKRVKNSTRKKRKNLSVWWVSSVAAIIGFLLIASGLATNGFTEVPAWWESYTSKEYDALEKLIEEGYGERLNISVEDNNVRMTITEVVADEMQTVIYYEIEDLQRQERYQLDFQKVIVENKEQLWDREFNDEISNPRYVSSNMNLHSESEYESRGRIVLSPLDVEEGEIQLSIDTLQYTEQSDFSWHDMFNVTVHEIQGSWSFEVPVTKHPVKEYDLNNQLVEIMDSEIRLKALLVGPTNTVLLYHFESNYGEEEVIDYINVGELRVNGRTYKQNPFHFGTSYNGSSGTVMTNAGSSFDTIFFEELRKIEIIFDRASVSVFDNVLIPVDSSNLPYTIHYKDNPITVTEVDMNDEFTTVFVEEELDLDREYELLQLDGWDHLGRRNSSASVFPAIVDDHGNMYDYEYMFKMEELDNARMFSVEHMLRFDKTTEDQPILTEIGITGYIKTINLDIKERLTDIVEVK